MMETYRPIEFIILGFTYIMTMEGIGFYSVRITNAGMEFYDRY